MAESSPESEPMIEVMMHGVLRSGFEQWLESRGLTLVRYPEALQEERRGTEQFFVTIPPDRAREVFGGSPA